jgi:histidinol dehydrogenase
MQRFYWNRLDEVGREACLKRPAAEASSEVLLYIRQIFDSIRYGGDAAVLGLRKRLDGVDNEPLRISVGETLNGSNRLPAADRAAIEAARENISRYHRANIPTESRVEIAPGVLCRQIYRPVETAGLYVPGGTAPLVSTLLMLVVPAMLAGVGRIVLMTPPRGSRLIDPAIAEAAAACGIEEIFAVGGAAAIAAMTWGTESVPRVDKIFGPGNIYVDQAKHFAAALPGGPAIDLPAGPSEVMIIADGSADVEFVAADLLAQAEHDVLAQTILVTTDSDLAKAVESLVRKWAKDLPRRNIAEESLRNGRIIIVPNLPAAALVANLYAPEHLSLALRRPERLLDKITNAGAVFLGHWSPEAAGDYASGPNHVLPTGGAARAYSGLSVASFMKSFSVQEITPAGLAGLAPTIERLADLEGLEAHRRSVSLRINRAQTGERPA